MFWQTGSVSLFLLLLTETKKGAFFSFYVRSEREFIVICSREESLVCGGFSLILTGSAFLKILTSLPAEKQAERRNLLVAMATAVSSNLCWLFGLSTLS